MLRHWPIATVRPFVTRVRSEPSLCSASYAGRSIVPKTRILQLRYRYNRTHVRDTTTAFSRSPVNPYPDRADVLGLRRPHLALYRPIAVFSKDHRVVLHSQKRTFERGTHADSEDSALFWLRPRSEFVWTRRTSARPKQYWNQDVLAKLDLPRLPTERLRWDCGPVLRQVG